MYSKTTVTGALISAMVTVSVVNSSSVYAQQARVADIVTPLAAIMAKTPPKNPVPVPPPPPPSPELAAMLKERKGTLKCKGVLLMADGSSTPLVATMTTNSTLGGYWIRTTWTQSSSKTPLNFESATTYDSATSTWHRLTTDNRGAQETAVIPGPVKGAMIWEASSRSYLGTSLARHSEEIVGKDIKLWGERSTDKGVTWMKVYETVCKR